MKLVQADILAEEWEEPKISAPHKENIANARRPSLNTGLAACSIGRSGRPMASRWPPTQLWRSRIAVHCHRERERALRWADWRTGECV